MRQFSLHSAVKSDGQCAPDKMPIYPEIQRIVRRTQRPNSRGYKYVRNNNMIITNNNNNRFAFAFISWSDVCALWTRGACFPLSTKEQRFQCECARRELARLKLKFPYFIQLQCVLQFSCMSVQSSRVIASHTETRKMQSDSMCLLIYDGR